MAKPFFSSMVMVLLGLSGVIPFSMNNGGLNAALLREMVARMGNDLVDYSDDPSQRMAPLSMGIMSRSGMTAAPAGLDYDELAMSPSLRDREYLSHSSLFSNRLHEFDDSNDGLQRFKPSADESKTSSEMKTDGVLPAYCNPPNPCPIGYTSKDGCLEEFENTAAFSRDYQSLQECMCDTEHMFDCPDSTRDSEITALARSIQNEGALDSTLNEIMEQLDIGGGRDHLVAKKFHQKKSVNPYLTGERLPIAAKKGGMWQMK